MCLLDKSRGRKWSGRQSWMGVGRVCSYPRLFQRLSGSMGVHQVLSCMCVCVCIHVCTCTCVCTCVYVCVCVHVRGDSVDSIAFLWALLHFCATNTVIACFELNCQWLIVWFLATCSVTGSESLFYKFPSASQAVNLSCLGTPGWHRCLRLPRQNRSGSFSTLIQGKWNPSSSLRFLSLHRSESSVCTTQNLNSGLYQRLLRYFSCQNRKALLWRTLFSAGLAWPACWGGASQHCWAFLSGPGTLSFICIW